ncbi:hypothetical protein PAMP_001965 [Pampus punctatissimus]
MWDLYNSSFLLEDMCGMLSRLLALHAALILGSNHGARCYQEGCWGNTLSPSLEVSSRTKLDLGAFGLSKFPAYALLGRGDEEMRRQGDEEMRRQGDEETRRQGDEETGI